MKNATSYSLNLAVAALLVLASATIAAAAAGNDTCVGLGADIGGTCTPLTDTTSGNNANTAVGGNTLGSNTTGTENTAIGAGALFFNTMGQDNTASGLSALITNTAGNENTATGAFALEENTLGTDNTATGVRAMMFSTGNDNTATGVDSLENNTSGGSNTAIGGAALGANTTGSNNIAVGFDAGDNLTTGSNNIDIFDPGVAAESNTIRIGTQGTQTATFIARNFRRPKNKERLRRNRPKQRPARMHEVVGALQARHPRYGRRERQADEAAAGHLPVQGGLRRYPAIRIDRRGSPKSLSGAGYRG